MWTRHPNLLKAVAGVFFIGYCGWNCHFLVSGTVPSSIFQSATGLPCPTTGGVRSITAYLRGDIWEAFCFNPFAPIFILLFCASAWSIACCAYSKRPMRIPNWMGIMWLISLLGAWIAKFAICSQYW